MKKEKQKIVVVENLNIDIPDETTTKGKVNSTFTIVDETEQLTEKLDKNSVFTLVSDYFCAVKFDDSILRQSLKPLVDSGIMSEDVFNATLSKAKTEFLNDHKDEIQKGENLSFSEVINKLKENKTLFQKVLNVCNLSGLSETDEQNYIKDGKVCIYRGAQYIDKDGNKRYKDVTLKQTYNGKVFEQSLFVEYRDITTTNILLAIRYYSTFTDSAKRLTNSINDFRRILLDVYDSAKKSFQKGFNLEQIKAQIEKAYNDFLQEQN